VKTSSSSAAEKFLIMELWKKFLITFLFLSMCFLFITLNHNENSQYIVKTLQVNGSLKDGDAIFKTNCVGCHGIKARGLVGPNLNSITKRLKDEQIINQVTGGLTPPMPSFEIDPENMSNLLKYLHSLE